MAHPISTTYLDVQTARASAALAAAGAFDTSPKEMYCPGFDFVTLYVTYTRGGAAGAVKLRIDESPDSSGTVWAPRGAYGPATVAAGSDASSLEQRETLTYTATGASAEVFTVGPLALNGAVERLRVAAAESGNAGAPGTVAIQARFSCYDSD